MSKTPQKSNKPGHASRRNTVGKVGSAARAGVDAPKSLHRPIGKTAGPADSAVNAHRKSTRIRRRAAKVPARAKKPGDKPEAGGKRRASAKDQSFAIVGIGASAGGLEAASQFLRTVPADVDMAFVLIQHLDPGHESKLTRLLARDSRIPVVEARNNARLKPGNCFVIPPNTAMTLSGDVIKLTPRTRGAREHFPIDRFLESLAKEAGGRAIGVILSGTGSDGTRGLLAVKAGGGFTLAQDERTAGFPAMPANAVAAGGVDVVLPPAEMMARLIEFAGHPSPPASPHSSGDDGFGEIVELLRARTDIDFSLYKEPTLRRRVLRREALHKLENHRDYAGLLRVSSKEADELFDDILIHVTSFFRDPAVFQLLRDKLFPELISRRRPGEQIRIWVPGCSTGEEVYSVAIALAEAMTGLGASNPAQIFGTDVHNEGLDRARVGWYPDHIEKDVSPEQLRLHFQKPDTGYRVNKSVREMCVFARHDLIKNPPLSDLDVICCRNLLIYFKAELQKRVFHLFHRALRSDGLLVLGASESIVRFADLFTLAGRKAKIYTKKSRFSRPVLDFDRKPPEFFQMASGVDASPSRTPSEMVEIERLADRIALERHAPAGVIINRKLEVLQFRGRTASYFQYAVERAGLNVLGMVREELVPALHRAVVRAMRTDARTRERVGRIRVDGREQLCAIEVTPFGAPGSEERCYLVHFEPDGEPSTAPPGPVKRIARRGTSRLEEDLNVSPEVFQSVAKDYERSDEEQRVTEEEMLASNEELRSTNEELEATSEEMQASNEELNVLNDELVGVNSELTRTNDDLHNLLTHVAIPLIIMDGNLCIRRFTKRAGDLFRLRASHVGRPLLRMKLPLEVPSLEKMLDEVLKSVTPGDVEFRDRDGRWWSLRLRPYKNSSGTVDGAILALFDIHAVRMNAAFHQRMREMFEAVVNTIRHPSVVLNARLHVETANHSFYRCFEVGPKETLGRPLYALGNGQWDIPELRTLLENILPANGCVFDYVVEHEFPHLGKRRMRLNARRLVTDGDHSPLILLAIEEEGERR